VFGVEIESCARCGGKLKVIVSIEGPQVIAKILAYLKRGPGSMPVRAAALGAGATGAFPSALSSQGGAKADLSIRGCLGKAGYTN
jgi:hypothetical protein